jgi:hypothetical protein
MDAGPSFVVGPACFPIGGKRSLPLAALAVRPVLRTRR